MMRDRVYVCHTYYHVYVAFLKEFNLSNTIREQTGATLILSRMSTDFEQLKERIENIHYFEEVLWFDEKGYLESPQLVALKRDRGILANMIARIRFTDLLSKQQEPYIPVDFTLYRDIYVFCDSDPIGYYLNKHKIPYHALEDGLDCLKIYDTARFDNRGCFRLKVLLSRWNLIFIQNGYGRYCIDMEINDRSCLKYDCPYYKELPRKQLEERISKPDQQLMVRAFMEDADALMQQIHNPIDERIAGKNVLILTEPLCTLEVRKQILEDIIKEYCEGFRVFIKPHPRDHLDYEHLFSDCIVLKGRFPLEVMNYLEGVHFDRAVSVFTQAIYSMEFVDEKIFLGEDFMDRYEAPAVHRYNDQI
ncbi:MAG: glycosyltransferase family 52 [Lachnospiraceae bacterium]